MKNWRKLGLDQMRPSGPVSAAKKTDNERTTYVNEQSARGKCLAEFLRNRTREPETADRPKGTTNCHHKIAEHEKFLTLRAHQESSALKTVRAVFPKRGTANSIASAIGKRWRWKCKGEAATVAQWIGSG